MRAGTEPNRKRPRKTRCARREPNSRSAAKSRAQQAAVGRGRFRAGQQRLRRQIGRANRVVQPFAGDRIHQARRVADRHPAVAGHAVLLPGLAFRAKAAGGCRNVAPFDEMPLLGHVAFQPPAQRLRRLALAADAHREMAAAGKDPDVAFELRQKLDVDVRPARRDVVAERGHRIRRGQLGPDVAQRIARAGGDDAEIGVCDAAGLVRSRQPLRCARCSSHARLFDLRAGALGALEQQPVQIEARIDQQRLGRASASLRPRAAPPALFRVMSLFGVSL